MKNTPSYWSPPVILVIAVLCMGESLGIGWQTKGDVQTIDHTNANEVERMPGDMNGDGTVDLEDAIETLEIVRGYKTASVEQLRNEPTEDGNVTIDDAIKIIRDLHTRAL